MGLYRPGCNRDAFGKWRGTIACNGYSRRAYSRRDTIL